MKQLLNNATCVTTVNTRTCKNIILLPYLSHCIEWAYQQHDKKKSDEGHDRQETLGFIEEISFPLFGACRNEYQ